MSQVLQEYKEMDDLRRQFEELMNVKGEEKIQMLVRVGYSKEAFYSYRRRINDLKMGKFST
jgi:copper oxidase (laccase) domain-containing protein